MGSFADNSYLQLDQTLNSKSNEIDYETDEETVKKARKSLLLDLDCSIQYYVKEEPLELVANVS